jgi:DNA polymerase III alpha subunit
MRSAIIKAMIIKASEADGIELLYNGKSLYGIPFDNVVEFNKYADSLEVEHLVSDIEYTKQFNIPQHYQELDVEEYIVKLIPHVKDQTDKLAYLKRVEEELALFKARNLFPVLQLLIYIVDTMRKHKLVWGVGRGSSVASYCLYLIGVHKIDSVKYNLNIREFLK